MFQFFAQFFDFLQLHSPIKLLTPIVCTLLNSFAPCESSLLFVAQIFGWKKTIRDVPAFRQRRPWGLATGFQQIISDYSIRRETGNVMNSTAQNKNDDIKNLADRPIIVLDKKDSPLLREGVLQTMNSPMYPIEEALVGFLGFGGFSSLQMISKPYTRGQEENSYVIAISIISLALMISFQIHHDSIPAPCRVRFRGRPCLSSCPFRQVWETKTSQTKGNGIGNNSSDG